MDILVAHDYRTGMHYAREFGMVRGSRRPAIITQAFQLRGHAPPTTFVYVNSDNAEPDPDVLEELMILESMGCEVDWVGIEDPREELIRLRMLESRQSLAFERWHLETGHSFDDIWRIDPS